MELNKKEKAVLIAVKNCKSIEEIKTIRANGLTKSFTFEIACKLIDKGVLKF